jgi:hypothetical protein
MSCSQMEAHCAYSSSFGSSRWPCRPCISIAILSERDCWKSNNSCLVSSSAEGGCADADRTTGGRCSRSYSYFNSRFPLRLTFPLSVFQGTISRLADRHLHRRWHVNNGTLATSARTGTTAEASRPILTDRLSLALPKGAGVARTYPNPLTYRISLTGLPEPFRGGEIVVGITRVGMNGLTVGARVADKCGKFVKYTRLRLSIISISIGRMWQQMIPKQLTCDTIWCQYGLQSFLVDAHRPQVHVVPTTPGKDVAKACRV